MKKLCLPYFIAVIFVVSGCSYESNLPSTPAVPQTQPSSGEPVAPDKNSLSSTEPEPAPKTEEPKKISGESGNETSRPALESRTDINMDSKGFNPAQLTIKAGTKVTFRNFDDRERWPASDPHPSHTICPGFDAKKGLKKGETVEFTFEKAQTCSFHDHLLPGFKGKIVITE